MWRLTSTTLKLDQRTKQNIQRSGEFGGHISLLQMTEKSRLHNSIVFLQLKTHSNLVKMLFLVASEMYLCPGFNDIFEIFFLIEGRINFALSIKTREIFPVTVVLGHSMTMSYHFSISWALFQKLLLVLLVVLFIIKNFLICEENKFVTALRS